MDTEYFEFLDKKRNIIFHVPVSSVTNECFLEDVSLKMKVVTQDMINITPCSSDALDKINNQRYLYRDFANEMLIHVQRVKIVDKLPDVQVRITQKGIETSGDVITWNKSDL